MPERGSSDNESRLAGERKQIIDELLDLRVQKANLEEDLVIMIEGFNAGDPIGDSKKFKGTKISREKLDNIAPVIAETESRYKTLLERIHLLESRLDEGSLVEFNQIFGKVRKTPDFDLGALKMDRQWKDGELFWESDHPEKVQFFTHPKGEITRDGDKFLLNNETVLCDVPYDWAILHPDGILIAKDGEYFVNGKKVSDYEPDDLPLSCPFGVLVKRGDRLLLDGRVVWEGKYSEVKCHPNGDIIIRVGDSFYLNGNMIYKGEFKIWLPYPNGVMIEKSVGTFYLNGKKEIISGCRKVCVHPRGVLFLQSHFRGVGSSYHRLTLNATEKIHDFAEFEEPTRIFPHSQGAIIEDDNHAAGKFKIYTGKK